ncbi:MAG: helix-turn-helix domain-containing protein [Nitrospira sp.]|nr:helix-turn-helix domain-containing protein [Nitrospira sp.]MCP9441364.1 helix-turn-helix domain-containing protein [Nitrospira sp.]
MLLRVHEAAGLLRVSKWTVYRWVEEGKLQATKIGGNSLRIFQSSVEKLITQRKSVDHVQLDRNKVAPKDANRVAGRRRLRK